MPLSISKLTDRRDKFDRYVEIVIGKAKGSVKQNEVLIMYRFAFSLACEGYTPLVISQVLAEKYQISQSRGFKIIREAKQIFGDAATFSKKGERYSLYEYMMRMSKKAESAGDYTTARNCAMDAAKLLGLDQPDIDGLIDPNDFMNPDLFIMTDDPKLIDAVSRTIEVTLDVDYEVVKTKENSDEQAS